MYSHKDWTTYLEIAQDATDALGMLLDRVQNDPAVRYGSSLAAELQVYRQGFDRLKRELARAKAN